MQQNNKTPLLSICCLAYNHAPYIRQCLDGFMMQKTDFAFEVLIHDDASTDGTADIIREYEAKYPDIIKPIYQTENQYSKGIKISGTYQFPRAKGKYIAMCEGDDYWIDPLKLQKQVDFLEANEDYSLCCHRYKIYDEKSELWTEDYGSELFHENPEGVEFANKLNFEKWLTKTMTLVFRKSLCEFIDLSKYKYSRDVYLNYELLKLGKGFCCNFDGAVYRKHEGGVFSNTNDISRTRIAFLVYSDLYKYNKEDLDVIDIYKAGKNNFFENIRTRIYYRQTDSKLFADICLLIRVVFRLKEFIYLIYIVEKSALSLYKSFKNNSTVD